MERSGDKALLGVSTSLESDVHIRAVRSAGLPGGVLDGRCTRP